MAEKQNKSQTINMPNNVSTLSKLYLLTYNFGQVFGWSFMLYQLFNYYASGLRKTTSLWDYIGPTVVIFQNAALLEIVHAATGIVRSNVLLTTFQVLSRVMVVCGVLLATPNAIYSLGLPLALFAWSITEIIRYAFYGLNLLNVVPQLLVFLRYTAFIVLYPTGVTGELLCFYSAQTYTQNNKLWSTELPNRYNFTFSYHYFLWITMLLYIPLFPQLYLHMFTLRKKVLGKSTENIKLKSK